MTAREAWDTCLSPHQLSSLKQYFFSHGPVRGTAGDDGNFTLWGTASAPAEIVSAVDSQVAAFSHAELDPEAPVNFSIDGASDHQDSIRPVSAANLSPHDSSWICEQIPLFSTALQMAKALRPVQVHSAKAVMTWISPEMSKHPFLVDGYLGQLRDIKTSLEHAETFVSEVSAQMLKVVEVEGLPGHEHHEAAKLIGAQIRNFQRIVTDAGNIRQALIAALEAKTKFFLDSQCQYASLWNDSFRSWMGATDISQRRNKAIRDLMIGDSGGSKNETITKRLDQLSDRIKLCNMVVSVHPSLDATIEKAREVCHTGRVYIACSGVINNTVVKKSRKTPMDLLQTHSKRCARGIRDMGLWSARPDGREIVSQETS